MALTLPNISSSVKMRIVIMEKRVISQLETLGERRTLDRVFPCGGFLWLWVSLGNMKALPE